MRNSLAVHVEAEEGREGAQKWIHDTPESGHRVLCDLVYNGHHMAGVIYSYELSRMYVGASLTRNVCN